VPLTIVYKCSLLPPFKCKFEVCAHTNRPRCISRSHCVHRVFSIILMQVARKVFCVHLAELTAIIKCHATVETTSWCAYIYICTCSLLFFTICASASTLYIYCHAFDALSNLQLSDCKIKLQTALPCISFRQESPIFEEYALL
jgi:hypothetical protein